MPIDPSILFRGPQAPPQTTPTDILRTVVGLQEVRDRIEARRQAAELARTKGQREAQIEQAYAVARQIDPVTGKVTLNRDVLLANVPASAVPALMKSYDEMEEALERRQKLARETAALTVKHLAGAARAVQLSNYDPEKWRLHLRGARDIGGIDEATFARLDALPPDQIKPTVDAFLAQFEQQPGVGDFTLAPGQQRFGPRGEVIAAVPAAPKEPTPPAEFTLSPGQRRFGPGGEVIAQVPPTPPQPPQRQPTYQWAIPPDSKTPKLMTPEEIRATGATPTERTGRPATGAERGALAFYNRGVQAIDTLTTPDATGTSLEDRVSGAGLEWVPDPLKPILQTEEQKRYTQAQRAFTEARLRKESGAAINPQEYENDRKTYFKQPNDPPAVVEQKRLAREKVLNGLAFSAGKAYEEYYGEPFTRETGTMVPGGSTSRMAANDPLAVTTPDGKTYRFKTAAEAEAFKKRAGLK